ncbi:Txe/YoeB family addiction module toxin [Aurantimonas sp. A3-2-R12]|uniref:Txe/YoeB family addiction module toxin n=1 Tax=Aurantimonas sp. A3-2-R12 TaxID=3114362 RepID=UPI002E187729|nr:Txe/YoeB family addiction module toxin [Aurantimonas sp. A3-2-R12]
MRIIFTPEAWSDYQFWLETDRGTLRRINHLIESARRTPFAGIGKPEALRGEFAGWWSRRINREHRLVYKVEGRAEEQTIVLSACRFHYGK